LKIVDKVDLASEEGVKMVEMDGYAGYAGKAGSAVMETSYC